MGGRATAPKEAAALAGVTATAHLTRSAVVRNASASGAAAAKDAPPPPPPPFDPSKQVGAMAPMGFFDPLGFSKVGDKEGFRKLRAAELKHGRVAMMGAVGAVFQHYVKFPGFEKVPAGLSAVNEAPGSYGAIALFLVAGALELGVWTESDDKAPGNFGDPMNFCEIGDGYTVEMRNRELNNGRAAMFAVMGIIVAELYTGKD